MVPLTENKPEYPRLNEPISLTPPEEKAAAGHGQDSSADANSTEYGAMPTSKSWETFLAKAEESDITECFIDTAGSIRAPSLHYFLGRPNGFPQHVAGSYEVLKLPEDICFDRYGRYGPYGFGYSVRSGGLGTGEHGEKEGSESVWTSSPHVDYRNIDWADVQRRCFTANAGRYRTLPPRTPSPHGFYVDDVDPVKIQARGVEVNTIPKLLNQTTGADTTTGKQDQKLEHPSKSSKPTPDIEKKARTAIVLRCWDDYLFREDDIANVRAMISEVSMASGGRYDVHLLVQVKNDALHPIWADHEAYQKRIRDVIPKEFQGLVTLWSETQMLALYQGIHDLFSRGPDLPVHGVYRGLSMAMQHFAYMHPEYDFFWQWEMDIRYTGHYFDLLTKLESWAKDQPRKGIWERSSRYYFPSVHGSWDDFSQMARVQSEMGTVAADNVWNKMPGVEAKPPTAKIRTVWGPVRPSDEKDWFEADYDPKPPTAYEADKYKWGVGEEADLISLNPIFDPAGTTWLLKEDITGYNRSQGLPPRRASIITTSRMSRRLLMTMHKSTAHKKQFAFPEMWPATVALHHGYKAVSVPHPIYVDRKWPVDYMAQTYNGGHDGSSGGSRTSLFGEREHNLKGLSWFYNSGFGPNLYRRWLGLKVNNDGGEEFEKTSDKSKNKGYGVGAMAGGEGRMCLPPMLLHPVKEVELPVEMPPKSKEPKLQPPESDPAA